MDKAIFKTMKNLKTIIFFTMAFVLFCLASTSSFGFGDVVTDPGSYTYYADQLKQAYEQYETLQEQLSEAKEHYDLQKEKIEDLKKDYYRIKGSIEWLQSTREQMQNDPSSIFESVLGFSPTGEIKELKTLFSDTYSAQLYANPQAMQAWLRSDRKDIHKTAKYNQLKRERQKLIPKLKAKRLAQKTIKINAIKDVSPNKSEIKGHKLLRFEMQEQLANAAKDAENLKDGQQVTNAILLQILDSLNKQLSLQAQFIDFTMAEYFAQAGLLPAVGIEKQIEQTTTELEKKKQEGFYKD